MTPEDIFDEVADAVFLRLNSELQASLVAGLRAHPGVWAHCVAIAAATNKQTLSSQLHELDLLVTARGWDYAFEDLEYSLGVSLKDAESDAESK
jgi:hypothetical protein